ncbi:mucin-13-like [Rhineura floridana]|uniref:mucin-13-like n=1 Tax=Rhineura floridana TaxID=261503 RepID=UPI002AC83B1F|nr:mucin-13-like [Rhineura floridana]
MPSAFKEHALLYFLLDISQCAVYGCDSRTTNCNEAGDLFPTCDCKINFTKENPEDRACLLCDKCSSEEKKYCSLQAQQVPVCQCLPGFEEKGKVCNKCPFGYSGENCKENYLAILVGVAVACGVVVLVLSGVLIYLSLRGKEETKVEKRSLLRNDYSTVERTSENSSAKNSATNDRIFPIVQARNPAVASRTTMANQGGQEKYISEAGTANKGYLPEQDYDDANNVWLEMSSKDRF